LDVAVSMSKYSPGEGAMQAGGSRPPRRTPLF
jgi:hypothetical protein